jgi:hypothetical protein
VSALSKPGAYPSAVSTVKVHETHVSWIFLTGEKAYKIKKALKFGDVLDYSTPARRKALCDKELRLNRAFPNGSRIYLGLQPIKLSSNGEMLLGRKAKGRAVEYAVETLQLPADSLLSNKIKASSSKVRREVVVRLARVLARFHARSRGKRGLSKWASFKNIFEKVDENFRVLRKLGLRVGGAYERRVYGFMREGRRLLEERALRNACENHGDFRLGNIFLTGQNMFVTDRIEFNDLLLYGDPAEDVAFMAMDLDFSGFKKLSALFVGEYVKASGDRRLIEVLPFYESYRAVVRAKVHAFWAAGERNARRKRRQLRAARKYLALAKSYLGG